MKVYFLGAGASVPCGAPSTNRILPCALAREPLDGEEVAYDLLGVVREFVSDFFGAQVRDERLVEDELDERLPQLGDVLSTLDQFRLNGESFGQKYPPSRIEHARRCVEYAIYRGLRVAMTAPEWEKRRRELIDAGLARAIRQDLHDPAIPASPSGVKVVLVTTNYDTLTTYALKPWLVPGEVDLGTDFANYPQDGGSDQERLRPTIALLKMHGSLDWMYCRSCRRLTLGTELKVATFKYDIFYSYVAASDQVLKPEGQVPRCEWDDTPLDPVLITPTLLKQYDNPHVTAVYRRAWDLLRYATSVTFIGYSLPPEDYHIIHLLKRTLVRPQKEGGFDRAVVDVVGAPEKPAVSASDEIEMSETERRYRRLFGDVVYRGIGLEGLVAGRTAKP